LDVSNLELWLMLITVMCLMHLLVFVSSGVAVGWPPSSDFHHIFLC